MCTKACSRWGVVRSRNLVLIMIYSCNLAIACSLINATYSQHCLYLLWACHYSPDMAVCAFKNLVDESSVYGTSSEYTELHCISFKDCNRDVRRHLELHKISNDEGVNNEMKLLLARAGTFVNIFSVPVCSFVV